MEMGQKIILSALLSIIYLSLLGQADHKYLIDGDKNYKQADFLTAEEYYRKALEANSSLKGKFNLGNSLYNQGRYEEAIEQFNDAINKAKTDEERANAYYNLGNANFYVRKNEREF